jgi:hypothetical protein
MSNSADLAAPGESVVREFLQSRRGPDRPSPVRNHDIGGLQIPEHYTGCVRRRQVIRDLYGLNQQLTGRVRSRDGRTIYELALSRAESAEVT